MQKPNLFFNILTFEFPSENQTFYFSKENTGKSQKLPRYPDGSFTKAEGFPFPIKLKFDCTDKDPLKDVKVTLELIDQVYQFSRIYWKSVHQQNLPVTIKYPEMVAEIFPHFEGGRLFDFGKNNLWFL
jgi:hypothetical protein